MGGSFCLLSLPQPFPSLTSPVHSFPGFAVSVARLQLPSICFRSPGRYHYLWFLQVVSLTMAHAILVKTSTRPPITDEHFEIVLLITIRNMASASTA